MMVVSRNRHGQEVFVVTISQALQRIKGNLEQFVPRLLVPNQILVAFVAELRV